MTIEEFTGKVWDVVFQPMLDKVRIISAQITENTVSITFGLRYTQAVD